MHRTLTFWMMILILVVSVGVVRQYHKTQQINAASGVVTQVVLAGVQQGDVPVYVAALGNVTPTYSVTVRTQVNGILLRVLYKEGQMVKAGELLAEIDPRPYEAQLMQYEGQLKRDLALLANARVDLKRYQRLWKQDAVSQQTLATQESLVEQDEGNVKTDQGLLEATKVNLIYTKITSPIDGRVGLRLVDPGNVVQTTDTNGLMVINTLNPITVIFTIPEDAIPEVAKSVYDNNVLPVECYDREQKRLLATGTLLTIDNQVDTSTGTVKLRAQFANEDNSLFPSQFVNIKLLVKTLRNVLIVPTAAIQYSSDSPFVYVLNNNFTVSATPVKVGINTGENTTITSGLSQGLLVVTEGVDKLTDKAKVKISSQSQVMLPSNMKKQLIAEDDWLDWRFFL